MIYKTEGTSAKSRGKEADLGGFGRRNICREKVREALRRLSASDASLIELLYFKEVTVTEAARIYGYCRKTIRDRHKRILEELYQIMQNQS